MNIRRGVCLVVLLSFTACTANPKGNVVSWLSAGERRIVVDFDDSRTRRNFQVHESTAALGAAKGAGKGALDGANLARIGVFPIVAFMLAVVFVPVGAVVGGVAGAATAEPEVSYYDLDEVEGASALFEAGVRQPDLLTLLKRKIANMGVAETGHVLVLDDGGDPAADANNAKLMIDIKEYSLVGELEDDPLVRLLVSGTMVLRIVNKDAGYFCSWSYNGSSRGLSVWSADGAKLFREEIENAAGRISQTIASKLRSNGQTCSNIRYHWADAPTLPEAEPQPAPPEPAEASLEESDPPEAKDGADDNSMAMAQPPADSFSEASSMATRDEVAAYLEEHKRRFEMDLLAYVQKSICEQPCRKNKPHVYSYEILLAETTRVILKLDYAHGFYNARPESRTFVLYWKDEKLAFLSHRET